MYWFLNQKNKVIYVGKAKNLKKRLFSYSRQSLLLPKTKKLLDNTAHIRFHTVETELDALILEAELIKLYQPQYNILLKDDKSPLYIAITNEPFPRVIPYRKHLKLKPKYLFGPYQSGTTVKMIIKYLRRAFKFCHTPNGKRACFYYHINLCSGACVGNVSQSDYQQIIHQLVLFLKGKRLQLIKSLTKTINAYSKEKHFEKAAELKTTLDTINLIAATYHSRQSESPLPNLSQDQTEQQLINLKELLMAPLKLPNTYSFKYIEAYDVSNLSGQNATVSLVTFKEGLPYLSKYKRFKIRTLNTPNDTGMLREALHRRLKHPEWGIPELIVIDGGRGQLHTALQTIPWDIPIISIAKNPDRLVYYLRDLKKYQEIELTPDKPASFLLQSLRNEAHRFAKKYHSLLYTKSIILKS